MVYSCSSLVLLIDRDSNLAANLASLPTAGTTPRSWYIEIPGDQQHLLAFPLEMVDRGEQGQALCRTKQVARGQPMGLGGLQHLP